MDEADSILPQYLQVANALKYVTYSLICVNIVLNTHTTFTTIFLFAVVSSHTYFSDVKS